MAILSAHVQASCELYRTVMMATMGIIWRCDMDEDCQDSNLGIVSKVEVQFDLEMTVIQ